VRHSTSQLHKYPPVLSHDVFLFPTIQPNLSLQSSPYYIHNQPHSKLQLMSMHIDSGGKARYTFVRLYLLVRSVGPIKDTVGMDL
jgi:hypothetical protein